MNGQYRPPQSVIGVDPRPLLRLDVARARAARLDREARARNLRDQGDYLARMGDGRAGTLYRQAATLDPVVLSSSNLVTPAYLTGRESGPLLQGVTDVVAQSFARMNDFYVNLWRPQRVTTYPSLPETLRVISGYRSFSDQASIVAGQLRLLGIGANTSEAEIQQAFLQILTTRSIPGFSRHHWGTEIDVVSVESAAWRTDPTLNALADFTHYEAPRFGFYTPYWEGRYPEPTRPHYRSEPWHLSYYPIARVFQDQWLARFEGGPGLSWLLDDVAVTLGGLSGVPVVRMRRVLDTLDLPSYQGNVGQPP